MTIREKAIQKLQQNGWTEAKVRQLPAKMVFTIIMNWTDEDFLKKFSKEDREVTTEMAGVFGDWFNA